MTYVACVATPGLSILPLLGCFIWYLCIWCRPEGYGLGDKTCWIILSVQLCPAQPCQRLQPLDCKENQFKCSGSKYAPKIVLKKTVKKYQQMAEQCWWCLRTRFLNSALPQELNAECNSKRSGLPPEKPLSCPMKPSLGSLELQGAIFRRLLWIFYGICNNLYEFWKR